MHFAISISVLMCTVSLVSAAHPAEIFRHAEPRQPVDKRQENNAVPRPPGVEKRASPFLNNATERFLVNGSGIPDVPFDVGESYAGLLPISGDADETRELFFWFFPSTNPDVGEEIAIW